MNRNWRNDNDNEHMGYSDSEFSPSEGNSGGAGRFGGDNYGRSGGGSYYGAGYGDSPYGGDDANSMRGRDRDYRDDHYENDRNGSYAGGRNESSYGRDPYYSDRDRGRYNSYDEYGRSNREYNERRGYGSYNPYNEEGRRRGASGNFTGSGYGNERNERRNEGRGYGLSDIGWNTSSFISADNYGRRSGYGQQDMDRGNYDPQGSAGRDAGRRSRRSDNYNSSDYRSSNTRNSFTGMSSYGSGNYDNRGSYGENYNNPYDWNDQNTGSSNRRSSFDSEEQEFTNRRSKRGMRSKGQTYDGGGSDNFESPSEGVGSRSKKNKSSDLGNTTRGGFPGGTTYSDPWL